MAKRPIPHLESRALDVAVGRAIADQRRAVGLSIDDAAARCAFAMTGDGWAAVEAATRPATLHHLAVYAAAIEADPLDLVIDALTTCPAGADTPDSTTRLVRTLHNLHPAKREWVRDLVLAMG